MVARGRTAVARDGIGARTSFAPGGHRPAEKEPPVRRPAAQFAEAVVRLIVAPFAAVAAALAGLLFAALLPICGIATISEGIAKTAWRFVRETLAHLPHLPARRA